MRKRLLPQWGKLPVTPEVDPPAFPRSWETAATWPQPRPDRRESSGWGERICGPTDRNPSVRSRKRAGAVGGEGGRWPAGAKLARYARLRPGAAEAPGRQPGPRPRALPAADRRLRHRVLQRRPLGAPPGRLAGGAGRALPAGGGGAAAAGGPPGRAVAAFSAGLPRRRPRPALSPPPLRCPRAPAAAPLPPAPAAQEAARGPAAGAGAGAAEPADRMPPGGGRGRRAGPPRPLPGLRAAAVSHGRGGRRPAGHSGCQV